MTAVCFRDEPACRDNHTSDLSDRSFEFPLALDNFAVTTMKIRRSKPTLGRFLWQTTLSILVEHLGRFDERNDLGGKLSLFGRISRRSFPFPLRSRRDRSHRAAPVCGHPSP